MQGSAQLLSLGTQCKTSRAQSSPLPLTVDMPATAREFLTKQLPAVLNKRTTQPHFFYQSRDYPSQGPTQPNSSLLQVSPTPQFLWCQCPQSHWVCTTSVYLPLHLYLPQRLSAPRSLLVLGCPPCSGKGGS